MTDDEIHDFGVEIVSNQLVKDGYKLIDISFDIDQNPQIVANKDGQLAFVTVRTAGYPRNGEINNQNLLDQLIEHAKVHGAIPYFASVGIVNTNGTKNDNEDEMGALIRGAPFYVNYRGLKIITRANQIKIVSEGKIRDFVPEVASNKISISKSALLEALNNMRDDFGDVNDLPMELVNTLANIYYRFFAYKEHLNSGGKSRFLEPFMPPAKDAITNYKNDNQFYAETVSAIEYAKNFVQAARLTRSQNPKLFPYAVTLILDTLKYNIKNANTKGITRRFIEREFKKVYEISNFYERALKVESELKS